MTPSLLRYLSLASDYAILLTGKSGRLREHILEATDAGCGIAGGRAVDHRGRTEYEAHPLSLRRARRS